MELNSLVKRLEMLLNKRKTWSYEIKVCSNNVEVTFEWDYDYGYFTIKPSKEGVFMVEDEYYVEKFDTIQQVADYLLKKDSDNAK